MPLEPSTIHAQRDGCIPLWWEEAGLGAQRQTGMVENNDWVDWHLNPAHFDAVGGMLSSFAMSRRVS